MQMTLELTYLQTGVLLCLIHILLLMEIFVLIRFVSIGAEGFHRLRGWISVVCLLLTFTSYQLLLNRHIQTRTDGIHLISSVPIARMKEQLPIPLLVFLLAMLAATLIQIILTNVWRKTHLSAMSVHDSFDYLPEGLCFYQPSGLPRQINHTMAMLHRELTGTDMQDAAAFHDALLEGALPGHIPDSKSPLYRLSDGRVYSFISSSLQLDGWKFTELEAYDVTEEYRLTEQLQELNRQAKIVNLRLKSLMNSMEYIIMEKELLELKISIHERLGQSLLLTKRSIFEYENTDPEARCQSVRKLLQEWQRVIQALSNEEREFWQRPYYIRREQAQQLGIELRSEGELPKDDRLIPVIDTAISVHVTNVLRHADGHIASISSALNDKGDTYVLRFTNDGIPPSGEVNENGGLKNLRREVETLGGSMEIISAPAFCMVLRLPAQPGGSSQV